MIYAPVIITTLCRYKHLKKGLDSLAVNPWAKYTDVYIALDFPPSEKYREGYERTRDMLRSYAGEAFKSFNVIARESNYGPSRNFRALIESIVDLGYDRWIQAEDDIEFSPNFIEYMDKCLEYFEDDDSVLSVCGYSYPLDWNTTERSTAFLTQATYSAWGTGEWRRKEEVARKDLTENQYLMKSRRRAFDDGVVDRMIAGRRAEYVAYVTLGAGGSGMESTADVACGPYLMLSGKSVVVPCVTKTRNNGFDNTGVNCPAIVGAGGRHSMDYDYSHQPLDQNDFFELCIEDSVENNNANHALLDEFLFVPQRKARLERLGSFIYRLFGSKGCDIAIKVYQGLRKAYRRGKF